MSEVEQNGRLRWQREIAVPYALDDRKQVMGVGPMDDIRIAFVGEAPGADEDRMGEPFVGRSGAYLHHYLKEVGIKSAGCYFTNVIDRKPPDTAKKNNDISSKAAVEAIEVQNDAAWQEMAWLKQRGVQVVVALGGTAAKFFGIKDSLAKSRGSIYEISLNWQGLVTDPSNEPYDFVVIPTYHPSYIMQGKSYQKKNEEMRSDFKLAWIEDLKSAHDLAVNGYKRPVEHFTTSPTMDQVIAYCSEAIATQRLTAVDIETSGFNPQVDKIVCIGLAHTEEDGICIPLYKTGPDVMRGTRYWTPNQEAQVKHWLEQVFANCPLVLQNAVFDVGYLQQAGWEISPECVAHDTMIAHHSLSPELPHNLGFITSIYGHTPYWKGDFLSRDTTIWEMNFLDLQTYNLRDCIVLHQVIQPMLVDMKEFGTESAYEEGLKLIGPIIEMQQTGALISKGRWNKWKKRLKESVEQLQAEMLSIANLPVNFTFAPAEVIYLLYGIESPKHEKAREWEKHKVGSGIRASKKELFDMLQAIKPMWLGAGNYTAHRNESGMPSLDKNGIAGLRMFATNRLAALNTMKRRTTDHDEEEGQLKHFTQWLDKYAEWKRVEKMEQMFRNLPIRSDGRLHPSLLIHGTATGRLSCSNPNLQQWNKDEGADEGIREIIIAPPDHVIVTSDFNNLEFRVMAYECNDKKMLSIIEQGLNQHDENTKALFGIDPSHPKWKTYRQAAKTYQFASQYGAGNNKLHETLTIRVPEANFTMADVKKMRSNFEATYSGWAAWCRKTQDRVCGNQYKRIEGTRVSENAFGRKRILYGQDYEIRNQAINNPSQSGAAHIMNDATYRIWKRLHREKLRARLQIQIHDELRFEVPNDELQYICQLLHEEMEKPIQYRDRTVVFPVNIEYGPDWYHLQEC